MNFEIAVDKEQALTVPEKAKAIIITSNDDYMKGEDFLALCKNLENQIHKDMDESVKLSHASWKASVALRDKYLEPLETGRKILKGKMISFQDQQERIRREEQAKAEALAKKIAEDEALALAAQLEAEGDTETAEAVLSEPVQTAPIYVPKTAPQASRLSAGRKIYYASVIDVKKLCLAIGQGRASVEYVMGLSKGNDGIINSPALNKVAGLKGTMQVDGVEMKSKTV